jgi:hypothetical protein
MLGTLSPASTWLRSGPFSLPLPVKLFPITALFGELKGGIIPQPDVPKDSKFKRWVGKRFSNGN